MWHPQIDNLIANKYRVIAPDLRGFGESHNFADINAIDDMAEDIAELLTALKVERAIFVGLSMGGYVLLNLFSSIPEKFAAIILCSTTAEADSDKKREYRLHLIEKIEKNGVQILIEEMLPSLISDFTKQAKPDLIKQIEQMFSEVKPKAAIAALHGMAERKSLTHLLPDISIPTSLIFGNNDQITTDKVAEQLNLQIKKSKLSFIENAAHYSNIEQPQLFNKILVDFINEVVI
ncbi:MAG: alpha/beta hydrolase [Acidobacteriota bacterium]|nr:alpha/beta hydrolase [Acidobacteriota bacterium]